MKNLKKGLKNNALTIGSWITIGDTSVAEIMAKAGFDWLTVDMEHSAITIQQAQELIRVVELAGCVPLVRVGENSPLVIKQAMDAGAHGVIVPMVNSEEDAVRAVAAVRYPPLGTRGVGLARAQGYGLEFDRYKEWVNKESIVVAQVEHIKSVENLEAIVKVDGIDALIVGPYDLSGSLGRPGEFDHPDVKRALKSVIEVAKKSKKTVGFHVIQPDPAVLREKIAGGYRFLAFSLDTLFLGKTCADLLALSRA